mmetsp:Transcript_27164/g.37430  ORF Transcript_27164/g.37430 Transcript_27164/m.37430 type:complete len:229 (-) Transcript_27164:214-900(-)
MRMQFLQNIFLLVCCGIFFKHSASESTLTDNHESCNYWASLGECKKNPNYMLENCKKSCAEVTPPTNVDEDGKTFYDIVEKDLNGNEIKFDIFKGKVVYLVNVASHCGYTEENYAEFRSLNKRFKDQPFEIVLAPCNQFGSQEPGDNVAIENFAKKKGFSGTILAKDEVNGDYTRPSFQYLKAVTGKSYITWNFDGKFLIDKKGFVHLPGENIANEVQELLNGPDGEF